MPLTTQELISDHGEAVSDLLAGTLQAAGSHLGLTDAQVGRVVHALSACGQLVTSARQGDYLTASIAAVQVVDLASNDGAPQWVARYLPILGELAEANSADEVEKILQAAAAPVGSWRGKRGAGNHSVTINGYLGAKGGWEWLGDGGVPTASSFHYGIYAPIGFEATMGICKSSSLGLFLSVLDLGAIVDFRTNSETQTQGSGMEAATVEKAPRVGLAQVFSPGLSVVWGIPTVPLVLGVGGSVTPRLRRVTFVGTDTKEEAAAFQVAAFLAVDVTILPF
jgi:hypothetical protein